MTFDDQLKRALDTLTDRLRDEIDRQVRAAMDELSASALRHADDVRRTVEADTRRATEEQTRQALEEQTRRAVEESRRAAEDETRRVVDETRRQVEDETRRRVEEEARRRTDEAVAAALAAVPPPPAVPAVSPLDERLLGSVRAMDAARSLTDVLDALIAGVARDGTGAGVWLARNHRLEHWRSTAIDHADREIALDEPRAMADAARTNLAAWDDGFAVPLAVANQVVAVLYASSGGSDRAIDPQLVELLARHAASRLETITAFRTARAMTVRPQATAFAADSPGGHDHPGAPDSEEQISAQRYARLLVSEIKLYHEQAVVEGRRDRDLATRLGGEIARARVMYEERVPPHVRARSDHFHDELVRTLADGDSTLLKT